MEHVKKLTEEETFYLKTYILYNNIWQQEGEQKRLFETYIVDPMKSNRENRYCHGKRVKTKSNNSSPHLKNALHTFIPIYFPQKRLK